MPCPCSSIGEDITVSHPKNPGGLWMKSHFYREGNLMHLDLYTVWNGKPHVFKGAVDLLPIVKAVAACHTDLHGGGSCLPASKVAGIADFLDGERAPHISDFIAGSNVADFLDGERAAHISDFIAGSSIAGSDDVADFLDLDGQHITDYIAGSGRGEYSTGVRRKRPSSGKLRRRDQRQDELLRALGDRVSGNIVDLDDDSEVQIDVYPDDFESMILGELAGEVGFGFNPFKAVSRAVKGASKAVSGAVSKKVKQAANTVKKIGRAKLVKQVSRQFKAVATHPAFIAVSDMAVHVPVVGPFVSSGMKTATIAAQVAKSKGNLLQAGLSIVVSNLGMMNQGAAANALKKLLPADMQLDAENIVQKTMAKGGTITALKSELPPEVLSQWSATARAAKAAVPILDRAKSLGARTTPEILSGPLGQTATLLPRVSDQALGAFAMAQNAISAIAQDRMLKDAVTSGNLAKYGKLTPSIATNIINKANGARLGIQKLMGEAKSSDPNVRANAEQALAVFRIVNQAMQSAMPTISGSGPAYVAWACSGNELLEIGCGCSSLPAGVVETEVGGRRSPEQLALQIKGLKRSKREKEHLKIVRRNLKRALKAAYNRRSAALGSEDEIGMGTPPPKPVLKPGRRKRYGSQYVQFQSLLH